MRLIFQDLTRILIAFLVILAIGEISELLTSAGVKNGSDFLFVAGLIAREFYFVLLVSLVVIAPCWLGMSIYSLIFQKHTEHEIDDPKI